MDFASFPKDHADHQGRRKKHRPNFPLQLFGLLEAMMKLDTMNLIFFFTTEKSLSKDRGMEQ